MGRVPPWRILDHGKVKIDIDPSMAGRVEVAFDLCCGTATSCALYYLLFYPCSIVIGIDKNLDKEWVEEHIPPEVRHRFFYEKIDVDEMTVDTFEELAQKHSGKGLKHVTRIHWSPDCRPNSDASRGHHRDSWGQPLTSLAIESDAIFERGCRLLRKVCRAAPAVCITIENPVSLAFPHLAGTRLLLKDPAWRMLAGSHCSNLCAADTGDWPQKDTYYLTRGVLRKFHLNLCDFDCKHLLDGTDRHKVVLCQNSTNLKDQYVIRDVYAKGLIPLGVFRSIDLAHRKWIAKRDARLTRMSTNVHTPSGEILARSHRTFATSTLPELASDEEDDSDSDDEPDYDSDSPVDESTFDDHGIKLPSSELIKPLRNEFPLPRVPMGDCPVHAHALCYPALQRFESRWNVQYMMPWQLCFADLITFDFRVRGNKVNLLLVYDLVTDGVRCIPCKAKAQIGEAWDKVVTMESLHLRPYKVTVVTDGCGAMHGILAENAFKRGIDHLPIVPHQPHLNNIEGIVASFKADVAACLLGTCVDAGPIHEAFVVACAEYVCYTRERFVPTRTHSALKDDTRSRFELNTGVPPRPGLVPFGAAGWCFIPENLRRRRGAPKYERAEPVLCVGYQHMYTVVYKLLTRHNTFVHSEQVYWDLRAPLGIFLTMEDVSTEEARLNKLDVDLFAKTNEPVKPGKRAPAVTGSALPSGTIRLNKPKVYDSNGVPRPKPYILDRITAVDGMQVEAACELEFPTSTGQMRSYRSDISYDLYKSKWIRIESAHDVTTAAAAASCTNDSEEAKSAIPSQSCSISSDSLKVDEAPKCFYRSVYDDMPEQHPEGSFSMCLTRHRRRVVKRILSRTHRRRQRASTYVRVRPSRYVEIRKGLNARQGARSTSVPTDDKDNIDLSEISSDHPAGVYNISDDDIRHACNIAMRDLPWKPYLTGRHSKHRNDVLSAYRSEVDSLTSTVLREIKEGDDEYETARNNHTTCRALLEWKRQGLFKCRIVIQGHKEDRVALDGPDFQYASDVVGMTAIRALFMQPLQRGEAIGQADISTAFLQSDLFPADAPPRYLMLPDPVTGTNRYFRQLGVVYGSASSSRRWQDTLHGWLVTSESEGGGGYTCGKNDPCLFYHDRLKVSLATYVDDLASRGQRANVEEAFRMIRARFKCKDTQWLTQDSCLDHLGMNFFQDEHGTYLSMENYIDAMVTRLGIDPDKGRRVDIPMSGPITDYTPLSETEAKWYQSATGMCGWLAGTGRPDLKLAHSRISAYMASPCKGAMKAAFQAVRYAAHNKHFCLFQPFDGDGKWVHFSDSDHAGNPEPACKRKSQLGYVSMCGTAPIGWGSKGTSVNFDDRNADASGACNPSRNSGNPLPRDPTCQGTLTELHPDVSVAAVEIYAASVALSEIMHLGYLIEEMGGQMALPYDLRVDNTTAISFSDGNVRRSKLKHIDVRQQWVEWLRDKGLVKLSHVSTKSNPADFFTKILDYDTFNHLRSMMMVEKPIDSVGARARL